MGIKRFIQRKLERFIRALNGDFYDDDEFGFNGYPFILPISSLKPSEENLKKDAWLDGIDITKLESITTSTGLVIDREKYENLSRWTVNKCENISTAITFIKSQELKHELDDADIVTEVNFLFSDVTTVRELNSYEIWELNGKFEKKPVILRFCSEDDGKFYIYWKSREIQNFLILTWFDEKNEDKKMDEFLMKFLRECLRRGHLGIPPTIKPNSKDAIPILPNYLSDFKGYNLMLIAAERGESDVIKPLFENGFSTELPNRAINAQSLAYNNQYYHILLMLLRENKTYPPMFNLKKCSEGLKMFYEVTSILHKSIRAGDEEKVARILFQFRNLRYFYNLSNESALRLALRLKKFKIYEILVKNCLCYGPDEDIEVILTSMNESERNNIRNIHKTYHKELSEEHVRILVANTTICQEQLKSRINFGYAMSAFNALNANPFVKIILLVVAASRGFTVLFDMYLSAVQQIESSNLSCSCRVLGRIFIAAGKIFNKLTECEAYGNLAHELCHYAMELTFSNSGRPYFKDDLLSMQEFEKINDECRTKYGEEEVIDHVYDCYPEGSSHAELIVRVPHLMILYSKNPEKLEKIKHNYKSLFRFYKSKVIPHMKVAIPSIKEQAEVETDVKNELCSSIMKRKLRILVIFGIFAIFLFGVTACLLRNHSYKYDELSKSKQLRIRNANVIYKDIQVKLCDLTDYYDQLSSDQIKQVLDNKILNMNSSDLTVLNSLITHNWINMTEKLKAKVLKSEIIFQNYTVKTQALHDTAPGTFNLLTSEQIISMLDKKPLIVAKLPKSSINFNHHRKFVSEHAYLLYYKFKTNAVNSSFTDFYKRHIGEDPEYYAKIYNEIEQVGPIETVISKRIMHSVYLDINTHQSSFQLTDTAEKTKLLLLAANGRTERSIFFMQLAQEVKKDDPMRWIYFVDLNDFRNIYNSRMSKVEKTKALHEFVDGSSRDKFAEAILESFYENNKTVVFWEGFERSSNDFNEFVLDKIQEIKNNTGNVQFISTSVEYAQELRKKLDVEVIRMLPLYENELKDDFKNIILEKLKKHQTIHEMLMML